MQPSKLYQLTEQASQKLYEPIHDVQSVNEWKRQMIYLIDEISELKLLSLNDTSKINHSSLDPKDWLSSRYVAHNMLDSCIKFIELIRDRPTWQPIPMDIRKAIENECLPEQGQELSSVCKDALDYILPYIRGNVHPRFWAWVMGEGTLGGVLSQMMMATMNINAGGCSHSAVFVERTVVHWMREIFGFPKVNNGGVVVSSTSTATVNAIATARRQFMANVRLDGLVNGPQLIVYASTEVHMCVTKALELLGFGTKAMHLIPVDENFSMKIDELKTAIENDRQKGLMPFCIVGSAGTVNTGSFDSLLELSSIAREEKMWFHVDGAFGSLIILDPERRHLVRGIEFADSLAFDFHKWLHCPYAAACILIRDGTHLESTFSLHPAYLTATERGCAGDKPWFCDMGIELSRPFRALEVWFTLKEHGTRKLGEKIADNCQQAQYLASLLDKYNDFIHVLRPITLNIVNFRFKPEELDQSNDQLIDSFNNEILADIQLSGVAVPSSTRIFGKFYIRVCIVSHRCVLEDFDIFVDNILKFYRIRLDMMK